MYVIICAHNVHMCYTNRCTVYIHTVYTHTCIAYVHGDPEKALNNITL